MIICSDSGVATVRAFDLFFHTDWDEMAVSLRIDVSDKKGGRGIATSLTAQQAASFRGVLQ